MMSDAIRIKKGETFVLHGQYVEDDGVTPKSLAGVALASQIRDKHESLVDDLVITVVNEALGTFTIATTAGTSGWAEGLLYWDLKQTVDGVTSITDTATINVYKAITR
jgi:hypothetical protein